MLKFCGRIVAVLSFCLFTCSAFALTLPSKPANYVNDYAQLLSPATVQNLNLELRQFEQQTTNQIVVAIFPSLDNESLEDVTTRLEDQWKIGQKGSDNGILLVIFVKEHQARIEVGYGLESVVPDALAGQIIQSAIVSNFRLQHYDVGVSKAIDLLMQVTKNADLPVKKAQPETDMSVYYTVGGIAFLLMFIFFIRGYRRWQQDDTPPPQAVAPQVQTTQANLNPQNVQPSSGKWVWVLYFILSILSALFRGGRGGGGTGGGFGGGGGGRSGGGGANGNW